MTECLYLADAYLKRCEANVVAMDAGAVVLDRTVFYPRGGGQPGDTGFLQRNNDSVIRIVDTRYGADREILHITDQQVCPLRPGDRVTGEIDWDRRYRHMRMHTALHFLGVALPYGVTGGCIGEKRSRLDFDLSEPIDKATVSTRLNELIQNDYDIDTIWTNWDELDQRPDLVRTLSVNPPRAATDIRLLRIADIDLQPCGGTHVRRSSEIGAVAITKSEKKGSRNRRVYVELVDP